MPELPDVEARVKSLRRWTKGHRLTTILPPDSIRQRAKLSSQEFVRRVKGKKVISVSRRGKWILLKLSDNGGIGIHLGMTGDISHDHNARGDEYSHTHFQLDDHSWIHYIDPRRFGKLIAARSYDELLNYNAISKIGPDPLLELTRGHLFEVLSGSSRQIKEFLIDQEIIGGLGNVYATEALWLAKIHPQKSSKKSQSIETRFQIY